MSPSHLPAVAPSRVLLTAPPPLIWAGQARSGAISDTSPWPMVAMMSPGWASSTRQAGTAAEEGSKITCSGESGVGCHRLAARTRNRLFTRGEYLEARPLRRLVPWPRRTPSRTSRSGSSGAPGRRSPPTVACHLTRRPQVWRPPPVGWWAKSSYTWIPSASPRKSDRRRVPAKASNPVAASAASSRDQLRPSVRRWRSGRCALWHLAT